MCRAAQILFLAVMVALMPGCGGQSSQPSTVNSDPPGSGQVNLTVTDTPPAGVTVLFFQLGITGATLTSQSGTSASLLPGSNTIPVNVSQLQTDSAFLSQRVVDAGTYTGMTITLSPSLQATIYNGSGAAIGSCANDSVCQLTPAAAPLTLNFTSAPFPVTVAANTPLTFQLDINLNTIIQPDLTVNLAAANGVTVSQLPSPSSATPLSAVGGLTGTGQGVLVDDPNAEGFLAELPLQTADGRSFTVDLTSNTIYHYPSSCSTDDFSCLGSGEVVNVALALNSDGNLLASEVTYEQSAGQTMVEGNIIQLTASGGNTMMDLILQQGPLTATTSSLPIGSLATVTVPSTGVTYAIDSSGFTLPSGLVFTNSADLLVGQQVSVVVAPGSVTAPSNPPSTTPIAGLAAITFTASNITLEPSQITGIVNSTFPVNVSGLNFVLGTYPNYFVPPAATAGAPPTPMSINITAQTTSATTFENLNPDNISGLAAGDVVSVKGWLFPYGVIPLDCDGVDGCAPIGEIAAETVVARPGPTPLF